MPLIAGLIVAAMMISSKLFLVVVVALGIAAVVLKRAERQ